MPGETLYLGIAHSGKVVSVFVSSMRRIEGGEREGTCDSSSSVGSLFWFIEATNLRSKLGRAGGTGGG